jgi:hypothetical protein
MAVHVVQIANSSERRVAIVEEPDLTLLREFHSVYEIAREAIRRNESISKLIRSHVSDVRVSYDDVYGGSSGWKLLLPIDVPGDSQRTLVTGTGLTHYGSARDRQAMHAAATAEQEAQMTDSMRMFEWGRQKGRPAPGCIGIAPEWFYKGDGSVLQPTFGPLEIPSYAEDGGEEAEVAVVYIVADDGNPYRIGMAAGNEFSDHLFERRNYLNLAGSKLRMCSIGPELVLDANFNDVPGTVQILRGDAVLWTKDIRTGENNMCHSLANIEHHHFKFAGHRQPGLLHVHFLGADTLSFGEGVRLQLGDVMDVRFEGFGRPLQNVVTAEPQLAQPVTVRTLN